MRTTERVRQLSVTLGLYCIASLAALSAHAAGIVTLTPASLAFGNGAVGVVSPSKSVVLKNTGTSAVSLTSLTLTGGQADDYAFTSTCGSSLAAGASCTIAVTFKAVSTGAKAAAVSIVDNATGSPQSVPLSGTGIAGTAKLSLSSTALAFGSQTVGVTTAAKTVTLTNSGTASLTLSAITLGGGQADDFALTNGCGKTLAVGATCTLSVTFKAVSAGTKAGNLSITDTAAGSPQTVTLSGTGVAASATASVKLTSTSLAFGNEIVGVTSAAKSVTVTNSGTGALSLTSITIIGGQADDYALTKTCGSSLAAGASCTVSVTFKPVSTGVKSASISLADNATGSPQSVTLSGTGIKATAAPTFSPAGSSSTSPRLVTLNDSTSGAIIYYTTDGSTPTTASKRYAGAICVAETETVKALAVATGANLSGIASAAYSISIPKGTFTNLHSFVPDQTDGSAPQAGVVMDDDGTLFGTTTGGGAFSAGNYNAGTAFKVTLCGTETELHSFGSGGSDGYVPFGELLPDGNGNFYGTTSGGGDGVIGGYGTVFKITSAGALTVVHAFPDAYVGGNLYDGLRPYGALIADDAGNLYGTTIGGASSAFTGGTVFTISSKGAEKVVHMFTTLPEGLSPTSTLVIGNDGNLWGTTQAGGLSNNGTVFKVTPAGVETVVYSFGKSPDAISPNHGLVLASDGNFYGTTPTGGQYGQGTIFKVTPLGAETVIHSFGSGTDGVNPQAALIQGTDGNLYGTTMNGGVYEPSGTVFKATLTGTVTLLYSFPPSSQGFVFGAQPAAPLFEAADGSLYGTTKFGGVGGGVVFRINRIVPLTPGATGAEEPEEALPLTN